MNARQTVGLLLLLCTPVFPGLVITGFIPDFGIFDPRYQTLVIHPIMCYITIGTGAGRALASGTIWNIRKVHKRAVV